MARKGGLGGGGGWRMGRHCRRYCSAQLIAKREKDRAQLKARNGSYTHLNSCIQTNIGVAACETVVVTYCNTLSMHT